MERLPPIPGGLEGRAAGALTGGLPVGQDGIPVGIRRADGQYWQSARLPWVRMASCPPIGNIGNRRQRKSKPAPDRRAYNPYSLPALPRSTM